MVLQLDLETKCTWGRFHSRMGHSHNACILLGGPLTHVPLASNVSAAHPGIGGAREVLSVNSIAHAQPLHRYTHSTVSHLCV